MAHPVTRAAGRSLGATLLTLVLIPLVCAIVFGVPALLAAFVPVEDGLRLFVFFGGVLVLLFGFVALALTFAMVRTGVLDPGFEAIGMKGRSSIPNIRNYEGQLGGRPMFGTYARRGGVLELSVEQTTGTKASFTLSQTVGAARELVGLTPLATSPDPALAGIISAGADPQWTSAFLAAPGVAAALRTLLEDPSGRELRWVLVRPGCVKITRRWIDPDAASATLPPQARALDVLVTACARLGPPARPLAENGLETRFRRQPMSSAFALVGCVLLVLIVPTALIATAVVVMSARPTPTVAPAPEPAPTPSADEERPDRGGRRRRQP